MKSFSQYVAESTSEDQVHKHAETRQDEAGNKQELSIHKGATIKTNDNNPGRYKSYSVYGHEQKKGLVYHGSQPHASIIHHQHDLKSSKSNGVSSPSDHETMRKQGRFQVKLWGGHHGASRTHTSHFVKTAAAARKLAVDHAKKRHVIGVDHAKAAATMHSYKGFSQGPYRPNG